MMRGMGGYMSWHMGLWGLALALLLGLSIAALIKYLGTK